MSNVYIVTADLSFTEGTSIVRVYRKLEDACKYVNEKTGMSIETILKRMNECGHVDAYDGYDGGNYYYDISEHVLE